MGSYLYGVVPAGTTAPDEPGLDGATVEAAAVDDDVAVLRSAFDADEVEPRRRHLRAHDRVLAAAMAAGPVLPLRFGIVTGLTPAEFADDIDTPSVLRRMDQLRDHVEAQLLWEPDEDAALRRVVDAHPELRAGDLSPVDQGRRVAEELAVLAQEDLRNVLLRLDVPVRAVAPVERRGATGARTALLVATDTVDAVTETVTDLATRAEPLGRLRIVAGLPPYSFADTDRPLDED